MDWKLPGEGGARQIIILQNKVSSDMLKYIGLK